MKKVISAAFDKKLDIVRKATVFKSSTHKPLGD